MQRLYDYLSAHHPALRTLQIVFGRYLESYPSSFGYGGRTALGECVGSLVGGQSCRWLPTLVEVALFANAGLYDHHCFCISVREKAYR